MHYFIEKDSLESSQEMESTNNSPFTTYQSNVTEHVSSIIQTELID